MKKKLKILIGCEYSGHTRQSFRRLGHDAWSCDLLPSEDNSPYHIQGNVIPLLHKKWDMILAHPTCTYLANSGVHWLYKRDPITHKIIYIDGKPVLNEKRWEDMRQGAEFFKLFLKANSDYICIENPIQHRYAQAIIKVPYSQIIQPYMFGHMESKATCLWLKGLPKLVSTHDVKAETMALPDKERQRLHYLPPGPDRWKERSRTFEGVSEAMAYQWSAFLTHML